MFRTMFSSGATRIVVLPFTALASALTTWLAIGYAGAIEFGFISLVGTLFLLVPFADLGLGAAVVNAVAADGAEGRASSHGLVRAAFGALSISAAGLLLLAAVLATTGSLADIVGIDPNLVKYANLAIVCAVTPFAVSLPFGVGQRILLGLGKQHLVNLVGVSAPLTALGVTGLLVLANVPPIFLALAAPTGVLVSAVIAFAVAVKAAGWRGHFWRTPRRKARRGELWSAAVPMMIVSIAVPAGLQSGRLLLAHAGSAEDLAEYAVAFQFYTPTFSIAAAMGVALWPHFARSRSDNRASWLRSLAAMGGVGLTLAVGFAFLIGPVVQVVSHGEVIVSVGLAVSLAALLFVMSAHQASATLLTTPRQLVFQAVSAVIMALVSVALGLAFVSRLGASGVVLAATFAVFFAQAVPAVILGWQVTKKEAYV